MRRKDLAIVLAAVMVTVMMTGCAGGSSKGDPSLAGTDSAETQTDKEKEGVTLTYISSTILESPEGDFEKRCIEQFNAQNNGITVEVEGVSANDLMKKYITLATSQSMPDFFLANMLDTGTIVDMGLAAEVIPIFGEEYVKGFEAASLAGSSVEGTAYGIPWFGGASGILYRKDIFEEKGVEIPKTWDDFVAASQKLTGDGSFGNALVGTNNGSGAGRFQYVLRNFGIDEFTKDAQGKWVTDIGSQKYIDALRAYTDLDVTYKTCPAGVIETDYPTAVNLFSSGKAAMLITGSNAIGAITSQVPELKGKLGSFPVPAVERSVSTPGGFGYFITPGKHEKESAEFIKFMLEKDREIEFSEITGRLPTRTEALADEKIKAMPELEGFLQARQTIFETPSIAGYSEINDVHGEAYQSVFTGESTVEEAAAKAQKRAEKICESANEG